MSESNVPRWGDWIQTYTGGKFWPLDPDPSEVKIADVAHSLAMLCRFNGHYREFYSVAQHSVLVSAIVPDEFAFWGLLHDAAEAYVGDMARPLKIHQPRFREIEDGVTVAVCERFGLPHEMPKLVKLADKTILATELRDLLEDPPDEWTDLAKPSSTKIEPWAPLVAKRKFLDRFDHGREADEIFGGVRRTRRRERGDRARLRRGCGVDVELVGFI